MSGTAFCSVKAPPGWGVQQGRSLAPARRVARVREVAERHPFALPELLAVEFVEQRF